MEFNIFSVNDNNATKVRKMYEYMVKEGFEFRKPNFADSSPYAIMSNNTAIGYRARSQWNKKGIVFFCSNDEVDKNALVSKLRAEVYDNSKDSARPYAIFIPDEQFEEAVSILKNARNNEEIV